MIFTMIPTYIYNYCNCNCKRVGNLTTSGITTITFDYDTLIIKLKSSYDLYCYCADSRSLWMYMYTIQRPKNISTRLTTSPDHI